MSGKYIQGFETMRDDSDFRTQGWLLATTVQRAAFPASISALSGVSLHSIGAGSSSTNQPGAASTPDIGYYNTGITVNQAWTAGGFTLGFLGKFNSGVVTFYGAGTASQVQNGIAFDGSLYWAIRSAGGTINVVTSSDLINWTATSAQPASITSTSSVAYIGSSTIVVSPNSAATTSVSYTTNGGASWLTTGALGASSLYGMTGAQTGNSSYPMLLVTASSASTENAYVYVVNGMSTSLSTSSAVLTMALGTSNYTAGCMVPFVSGGIIAVAAGTTQLQGTKMYMATASGAINTSGGWTAITVSSSVGLPTMMAYNASSNVYMLATNTGIWTTPNTNGSAGTPAVLPAAPTWTQSYSTAGMNGVYYVSGTSTAFAVGNAGHIITSTNGTTWTESGGHLIPQAGTYSWNSTLYDGTQYIMCSDSTSGIIAVTPDGVTNYTVKYVMDGTENNQTSGGNGCDGITSATAAPTSGSTWTRGPSNINIRVSTASSGQRGITLMAGNTTNTAVNVSTSTTHYYELYCTPTSGTTNSFATSLYIDGVLASTITTASSLAGTSDTTSLLILTLNRSGSITAWDDMYFCLNDGSGISGPQGIVNIIARRPTTDVQDQWVKTGTAASNALSVSQNAASSNSPNYLTSASSGDKDIYTSSTTIPAGYMAKSVQIEGIFTRTSTTSPVVNLGLNSGGTESDGSSVTLTTNNATYVNAILDKNPNGSIAWTNSTVVAAEFVVNHVT